jgi:hypothetical protein
MKEEEKSLRFNKWTTIAFAAMGTIWLCDILHFNHSDPPAWTMCIGSWIIVAVCIYDTTRETNEKEKREQDTRRKR